MVSVISRFRRKGLRIYYVLITYYIYDCTRVTDEHEQFNNVLPWSVRVCILRLKVIRVNIFIKSLSKLKSSLRIV